MLREVTLPVVDVVRGALRRESYVAQVREAASLAITATMWPLGVVDRGLSELRSRAAADRSPIDTPVLLIHGYGANKSNWFLIERELRQAGFERVHGLNYNPLSASIPQIADAVTQRAEGLMAHFGVERIHLIGHSTGGVVARYAVQITGLEGVDTCISIASPHKGTRAARLGFGETARQLRPGSDVMRRLHASSRPLPTRFVCFYSNVDVLSPGWCSRITEPAIEATNVLVKDEGHLSMMLSRRVAGAVAAQLAAAEGRPGYGAPLATLPLVTLPLAETGPAWAATSPPQPGEAAV